MNELIRQPVNRPPTRKNKLYVAVASAITILLGGCGGGAGSGDSGSNNNSNGGTNNNTNASNVAISGAAVNSPLINATVEAYLIDLKTGKVGASPIANGTTGDQAQLKDLSLPSPITPPYLLKFTVNSATTTPGGGTPELKELNTLILATDKPVYATAISSMAVLMANNLYQDYLAVAGNENKGSLSLYESFVKKATNTVKDTLGYGLLPDNFNVFTTSPMINSDSATPEEVSNAVLYRTASNAVVKTVVKLAGTGPSDTTIELIKSLAADLEDGAIDGTNNEGAVVYTANTGALNNAQISSSISQVIAEAAQIEDIVSLLNQEKGQTGGGSADIASQPPAELKVRFVADADNDGIPDNKDNDSDNDGVKDEDDALPLDASEWLDTDADGVGNNKDTDDDGDNVLDSEDDFPLDSSRFSIQDQDNDGWPADQDINDNDPTIPGTTFSDLDKDGIGDATDTDIDGDGFINSKDAFAYNPLEWSDTDGDGVDNNLPTDGSGTGDNSDPDIDGDSVSNDDDIDPFDASVSALVDLDNDGIEDSLDLDIDGDGLLNDVDGVNGAHKRNPDRDNDGTKDGLDNCVDIANQNQADSNNNNIGLACELQPTANSITDKQAIFNKPITVTLSGSDGADSNDALSYHIATEPLNGEVTITGTQAVYTPNLGFTGDDSFGFTVNDGEQHSSAVSVNIKVNPELVISSNPLEQAFNGVAYSFDVSASGGSGADYTYSLSGNPSWMSINNSGLVSGTPPNGSEGMTGEIVIKVTDGLGAQVTLDAFVVTVSASSSNTLMHWDTDNWNSANWQ